MDIFRVWLKVLQLGEVGLRQSMVITDEILVCITDALHERNFTRPGQLAFRSIFTVLILLYSSLDIDLRRLRYFKWGMSTEASSSTD